MNTPWVRSAVRRFPPIARRDELIARLRRDLRDLRATTAALEEECATRAEKSRDAFARIPSFQTRIHTERRLRKLAREVGAPSTSVIRHGKFHVYDLVRSHGIETPTELGRWHDPGDIPWAALPDLVVVKSAFGSHARGTWPLQRLDDGWRAVGDTQVLTDDGITTSMSRLVDQRIVRGPFVAEEFLDEDGTAPTTGHAVRAVPPQPTVVGSARRQNIVGPFDGGDVRRSSVEADLACQPTHTAIIPDLSGGTQSGLRAEA